MHGLLPMLNRKGRKRKSGRRTTCGYLARAPVDYRAMAGNWPHRKSLPEAVRSDERGESVIGRLSLTKRISGEMYEAGRRFAVIVGAYRAVIGTPNSGAGSGRGYVCEPTACMGDRQAVCLCEERTARYRDATKVLILAGQSVYNVTYRTAISDEPCNDLPSLRNGLDALARQFGLVGKGK